MADTKISALTAATTPLAGTEVLPIVQSGATVKVANNDLRPKQIQSNATSGVLQVAGPTAAATRVMTTPDANFTVARTDAAQSFTGNQTLSTGNLIIGTSGQGIDFSATPGTGTSELLADYEEGTFTPTIAGNTTAGVNTYTTQVGRYTKVGNRVNFDIAIIINAMGTGGNAGAGYVTIAGLPFTPAGTTQIAMAVGWLALVTFSNTPACYGFGGNTYLTLRETQTAAYGNTISITSVANGAYISVSGSYSV